MDPILLIVFLLIFTIAGLGWIIRLTYSTGALHEMNAGARLYQETRYAEAEAHFRRLLTKSLSSGVEADTRRRLADTLDILGKPSEAAAERDCAKAIVTQSPRDARAHWTRGDAQASRLLCDEVVSRSSLFLEDRGTQNGVYSTLGRAAFVLGDLAECKKLFEIFLDWKPSPVGLLSAHYWLGETHLRLGETETAREAFRQATAPGIDSLDARRAAARLAELGG